MKAGGIDGLNQKTSVALADPGAKGKIRSHGEVATPQVALERLIRRIAKARQIPLSRISVCYEAGGCGMWIARMLLKMKVPCTVIAPSLIPTKSGDHVKTDSRAERDGHRIIEGHYTNTGHPPRGMREGRGKMIHFFA